MNDTKVMTITNSKRFFNLLAGENILLTEKIKHDTVKSNEVFEKLNINVNYRDTTASKY